MDAAAVVAADLAGEAPADVAQAVPADAAGQVPFDAAAEVAAHLAGEATADVAVRVCADRPGEVAGHIAGEVAADNARERTADVAAQVPADAPLRREAAGDVPAHVARDAAGQIPGNRPDDVAGDLRARPHGPEDGPVHRALHARARFHVAGDGAHAPARRAAKGQLQLPGEAVGPDRRAAPHVLRKGGGAAAEVPGPLVQALRAVLQPLLERSALRAGALGPRRAAGGGVRPVGVRLLAGGRLLVKSGVWLVLRHGVFGGGGFPLRGFQRCDGCLGLVRRELAGGNGGEDFLHVPIHCDLLSPAALRAFSACPAPVPA